MDRRITIPVDNTSITDLYPRLDATGRTLAWVHQTLTPRGTRHAVRLWDRTTPEPVEFDNPDTLYMVDIDLRDDGRSIVAYGRGEAYPYGVIITWDASGEIGRHPVGFDYEGIRSVRWIDDGRILSGGGGPKGTPKMASGAPDWPT